MYAAPRLARRATRSNRTRVVRAMRSRARRAARRDRASAGMGTTWKKKRHFSRHAVRSCRHDGGGQA
jgi:hypothetical protein